MHRMLVGVADGNTGDKMKQEMKVKHEWSGAGRVLVTTALDGKGKVIAKVNVTIPNDVDPMGKVLDSLKSEMEQATSSLARTLMEAIDI